ncbi:hypothetical protein B0A48_17815 [Cryoendolithus antarcticus]|uniref:Vacuolar membrane PQ loop repeat protein n=1 Tax=Cryoendolithus antarcticus TaxID=1507870 RepID=A0A1V8SB02_9PEZI|nr:hypothetical protein B0A48_17815 [Cryoendolithus antarcticus]
MAVTLTPHEALSGIFGSISLASWIFLLVPQLLENYTNGNADGISLPFLLIWAAGDVLNLAGALWAGLVPTVIALAVYFCFADGALIAQCVYYRSLKRNQQEMKGVVEETSALLGNGEVQGSPKTRRAGSQGSNIGLPGSHRRPSSTASLAKRNPSYTSSSSHHRESLAAILEEPTQKSAWLKNTLSIIGILFVGTAGWAIAYRTGTWQPVPEPRPGGSVDSTPTPLGAELLGYGSAVLYLGARIPQIIKNQRSRSCEGLSLLFFMLSLVGNASYGAGILFHSLEGGYVMTNLPWLIGSLGTMVEDGAIFVQFSVFGEKKEEDDEEDAVVG